MAPRIATFPGKHRPFGDRRPHARSKRADQTLATPTRLVFEPAEVLVTAIAPPSITLHSVSGSGEEEDGPAVALYDVLGAQLDIRHASHFLLERHYDVSGTLVVVGAHPGGGRLWNHAMPATLVIDTQGGILRARGRIALWRSTDGLVLLLDGHLPSGERIQLDALVRLQSDLETAHS